MKITVTLNLIIQIGATMGTDNQLWCKITLEEPLVTEITKIFWLFSQRLIFLFYL